MVSRQILSRLPEPRGHGPGRPAPAALDKIAEHLA